MLKVLEPQACIAHEMRPPMKKSKSLAGIGLVAGLGIGGLVGVTVFAPGSSNAQTTTSPAVVAPTPGAITAPTGPGSNDANDANEATETHGKGGFDRTAHEAQEATDGTDAALLAKATITPAQATAAALLVTPGTAGIPDIHDRDGGLSYRVEVTMPTGVVEVTVDAKTGVAAIETEGNEHHGRGNDGNDVGEQDAPAATTGTAAAA